MVYLHLYFFYRVVDTWRTHRRISLAIATIQSPAYCSPSPRGLLLVSNPTMFHGKSSDGGQSNIKMEKKYKIITFY